MSGYFSRLIQQTEIDVGRNNISSYPSLNDPHFSLSESEQFLSPSLETTNSSFADDRVEREREEVQFNPPFSIPQSQSPIPNSPFPIANPQFPIPHSQPQQSSEGDRQPIATPNPSHSLATRPINLQTVREWIAETPEEKSNPSFPIPKSQSPTGRLDMANGSSSTWGDPKTRLPWEPRRPSTSIPHSQFPIPNSPFPIPHSQPQQFDRSDRQPIATPNPSNSLATRPIYLQTVRDWVAETPEEKSNSQIPKSQIPNPHPQIPNLKSQSPNPHYPFPIPHSPITHSQPQNFVLSIGTIRLTVEAPQPEPSNLPPLPRPKQEVKPMSQTPRLNRHYIRH